MKVNADCACPLGDPGPSLTNSLPYNTTIFFMLLLENYLKQNCKITEPCKRIEPLNEVESYYDFIVVGAGTAGSIVAGRLSENEKFNVLLMEAGGQEPIGSRVPSFIGNFLSSPQLDWRYRTVPGNYCLDQGNKGCSWPRGKGLGGSSLLNGMKYHRGHPADYDDWVNAGATGWSWEENLPYFDRIEGIINKSDNKTDYLISVHMPVQKFRYQPPVLYDLAKAAEEAGFPLIADINNNDTPWGFGTARLCTKNGQRYTTARAYLKPKRERPNLSVIFNTKVTKIIIKGRRAYGVEFVDKSGEMKTVRARKEVILSAGALNTPQILLLSGIGPEKTLSKSKIPMIANLPVGQNLKNHLGVLFRFNLTTLHNYRTLDREALDEYLSSLSGPMSANGLSQFAGQLYSSLADRACNQSDLLYAFSAFIANYSETGKPGELIDKEAPMGLIMGATVYTARPRSVGYVTLNSTHPLEAPLFYPNFFSHPDDMVILKDGIKNMRKIFETKILQNKYRIILDPSYILDCSQSGQVWSEKWAECLMRLHTDPQNHQLGTAAMGKVIDPQLRVYNIKRLRVIDASSMPISPTGNIQGAVMLIAERGADFIKKDWQRQS